MEYAPYLFVPVTIVLLLVYWYANRDNGPSVSLLQEIRSAIVSLQQEAAAHITKSAEDDKIPGMTQAELQRQVRRVGEVIRFVYTIEEAEEGLIHTLSSQLIARKTEKFQVECMLIAMLFFNQQLEAAGIDPKTVNFDLSRSEMGTHYLAMALSQDQHQALLAHRNAA